VTAAAQTAENVDTAIANNAMSHVDQTDQYGDKINYSINGYTSMTDPESGTVYKLPEYSETTSLSPAEQKLYNTTQQAQQGEANTANTLLNNAQKSLETPIDLSSGNVNNFINTQWEQPFQYEMGQQQEELNQQLADQGIAINDPAYKTAQMNFGLQEQNQQDTYDTAMYGQGLNALQTQYNQPINELTALESGSQINNATFQQTQTPQIPTTDYAQIVQNSYQDQLASYNAQLAQSNATMGGLFGLGGNILGGLMMA
jgi:hypothetical protein